MALEKTESRSTPGHHLLVCLQEQTCGTHLGLLFLWRTLFGSTFLRGSQTKRSYASCGWVLYDPRVRDLRPEIDPPEVRGISKNASEAQGLDLPLKPKVKKLVKHLAAALCRPFLTPIFRPHSVSVREEDGRNANRRSFCSQHGRPCSPRSVSWCRRVFGDNPFACPPQAIPWKLPEPLWKTWFHLPGPMGSFRLGV